MISGLRHDVNEDFALLGCCAAYIGIYWRFGTTYHGSDMFWNVGDYQSGLRNIPEERRSEIDLSGSIIRFGVSLNSVSCLIPICNRCKFLTSSLSGVFLVGHASVRVSRLRTVLFCLQLSVFLGKDLILEAPLIPPWLWFEQYTVRQKQRKSKTYVSFFCLFLPGVGLS